MVERSRTFVDGGFAMMVAEASFGSGRSSGGLQASEQGTALPH